MVTVEEIQEAIKNRKPIFYPNNRISYDAYKFLRKVTKADRDILLSEFPPFDPQKRHSLFIVFTCPLCGKEFEISFSKAKFYRAQNEAYMCRSAKNAVIGLCFSVLSAT